MPIVFLGAKQLLQITFDVRASRRWYDSLLSASISAEQLI